MANITLDDAMIPAQRTNQVPDGIFGKDSLIGELILSIVCV
jgi:hypothetical protein